MLAWSKRSSDYKFVQTGKWTEKQLNSEDRKILAKSLELALKKYFNKKNFAATV